jgi:uncharacterized protein YcaQ
VIAPLPPGEPITRGEARALALTAQGFDRPRPQDTPTANELRRVLQQVGLLQLDSVNVFCRSHYMPLFSRLGAYDRGILDRMAAHTAQVEGRELIEYWGHEASLLTPELYTLLRWRRNRADREAWKFVVKLAHDRPELVQQTLELVADHGPIRAGQTSQKRPEPQTGQMWNWHDGKNALEYLFYDGRVASAGRINFERLYDLPDRVLPAEVLAAPEISEPEAQRGLVRFAARASGVATESDLGDYFRLTRTDSKRRVAELVDAGELQPTRVEGWTAPAYMPSALAGVPSINARALLSPFDSLIWTRERIRRLFGFDYHLEIYTPAAKRRYGYYVLPFLLGDTLVARVDLKADRKARTLIVQGAFVEESADPETVAGELAAELHGLAGWLRLESVQVAANGDLAAPLAEAVS